MSIPTAQSMVADIRGIYRSIPECEFDVLDSDGWAVASAEAGSNWMSSALFSVSPHNLEIDESNPKLPWKKSPTKLCA
jgi:hypothetical protein